MYICRFVEHKKSVRKFAHGDEYHDFALLKCVSVFPLKNQPVELCIEGVLWQCWQCCVFWQCGSVVQRACVVFVLLQYTAVKTS